MKRWLNRGHLNRGGDRRYNDGYTIVETLIVLAVTAAMFSAILVLFRGRQARVEFSQAVRDYEAMLQNIISDTSKGYYSSDGYKCELDPNGTPDIRPSGGSTTGSNGDCIFLGFLLEPQGTKNQIDTIVGSRYTSITGADPKEESAGLFAESVQGDDSYVNAVVVKQLTRSTANSYQLKVSKMVSLANTAIDVKVLAIAGYTNHNSQVASRQATILAFRDKISDSATGHIKPSLFKGIAYENILAGPAVGSDVKLLGDEGILICLEGQNGQKAEIKLGSKDQSGNIFTTIDTHPVAGVDPCA